MGESPTYEDTSSSSFRLPYDLIAEAFYENANLNTILQQQINQYLFSQGYSYRVKIANRELSNPPDYVEKLNSSYAPMDAERMPLQAVFKADWNNAKTEIEKAWILYGRLKQSREEQRSFLPVIPSRVYRFKDPSARELDLSLARLAETYLTNIGFGIGQNDLLCLRERESKLSMSIGFNFLEGTGNLRYLSYFACSGWRLHPEVGMKISELKASFSPSDSNINFLLKLILIVSVKRYEEFASKQWAESFPRPKSFPTVEARILITRDIWMLWEDFVIGDRERNIWEGVWRELKKILKGDAPFEEIARAMLLMNAWNQRTDLGIYPQVLRHGEELFSEDFEITFSPGEEDVSHEPIWNYIVVTTIEDFFMRNTWLKLFEWPEARSYLVVRPIFVTSECLGVFFVTGTYGFDGRDAEFVRRNLLPRTRELLPFLEREFQYVIRFILSQQLVDAEARQVVSGKRIEQSIATEDPVWNATLETYVPTRKLVADKMLDHAIQAAIAAIMSRNVSHNIGSHVDFYMSDANRIDALPNASQQAADLFRYHRERFDFISEVISGGPCWAVTARFHTDVLQPFLNQTALLRFICESEGIDSVTLELKTIDDTLLTFHSETDLEKREPFVSLVGGLAGAHAFYSILENIIRNSAKHTPNRGSKIAVFVELREYDSQLYQVTVSDDASDYDENKAKEIRFFVGQPVVTDYHRPTAGGWGVKEIRICTEYLRMLAPEEAETTLFREAPMAEKRAMPDPPLIEIRDVGGRLAYTFYIPKPTSVPVVEEGIQNLPNSVDGVQFFNRLQDLPDRTPFGILALKAIERETEDLLKQTRENLPARLVMGSPDPKMLGSDCIAACSETAFQSLVNNVQSSSPNGIADFYRVWIASILQKRRVLGPVELWISFDLKDWNAPFINRWQDLAGYFNDVFKENNWRLSVFVAGKDENGRTALERAMSSTSWLVIYEHHRAIHGLLQKPEIRKRILCYDGLHKAGTPFYGMLCGVPAAEVEGLQLALGLLEAGAVRVCVADERIEASVKSIAGHQIVRLLPADIIIPNINYKNPTDADAKDLVKASEDCFCLIIHQGILDKAHRRDQRKTEAWIEDEVKRAIPLVVVLSGRGKQPERIPRNARFLPLSSIDKWIIEGRSKFHLVQTIMASSGADTYAWKHSSVNRQRQ